MTQHTESKKIKVGIVGGTGYTGVELLRILCQHSGVQLHAITSRKEDGLPVATMYPSLRGHVDLCFQSPEHAPLFECDVVFFATPHGVAMAQARELVAKGVKVIDLAADFRIKDEATFTQWYGMPHACPELLAEAVYGLPETHRAEIKTARVVGNPGCYPTTMQLGLLPLLKQGDSLIQLHNIISNSISGVSGAGRKAELTYLLTEAGDNFKAYGMAGHRHYPETVQELSAIAGQPVGLTFVPHLAPMIRGMHSTIYATIQPHALETDFQALFEAHYANEPFVDVMPAGSTPETRSVRGANTVRIAVHKPQNHKQAHNNLLIILVVQDNLVKGSSGAAVQCMNLMFGLPETMGLMHVPLLP